MLDLYFLENRTRILEVASFLDRIDRSAEAPAIKKDHRYRSMLKALELLSGKQREKTETIQLIFSDRSSSPIASAAGMKATGAWEKFGHEDH